MSSQLESMSRDQSDFPGPRWLLAELTYKCPLQCPYCSNPVDYSQHGKELDTDTWIRVLGEARKLGAVQLGLSGGEPLVRKDLEQIVAAARDLGFYTNLITSGIGMDAGRIAALKSAGLDHIQISFQASDGVLNDRMAGTTAFEHKKAMAREVKAQGYPMVLNFVLYRENIDRIAEIIELALDLDADQVELANTQYYGWGLHNRDGLLPTQEQLASAESVAKRYQQEYGDQCRILYVVPDYYEDRPKACMAGWGNIFLNIAPDGVALPCQAARQIKTLSFPNVMHSSIEDIWFGASAFNAYRGEDWMKEPCRSCEKRHEDFGGCRCQAYQLTGDAANTDPVCGLSSNRHLVDQAIDQAIEQNINWASHDADAQSVKVTFRNTRNSKQLTGRE